jgi:DnaK suppressor protein
MAKSKVVRKKVVKKKTARTLKPRAAAKKSSGKLKIKMIIPKGYGPRDLRNFKELILEKRKETIEELDNLKESIMDVTTGEYVAESSTYSMHMEQGTDAMEREKTFLFASRGSKFVSQLDDASQRIENGTYGLCRVCELLVPKERLEAVPTAQTCAEYKNTNLPCARGKIALAKIKKAEGLRAHSLA